MSAVSNDSANLPLDSEVMRRRSITSSTCLFSSFISKFVASSKSTISPPIRIRKNPCALNRSIKWAVVCVLTLVTGANISMRLSSPNAKMNSIISDIEKAVKGV